MDRYSADVDLAAVNSNHPGEAIDNDNDILIAVLVRWQRTNRVTGDLSEWAIDHLGIMDLLIHSPSC